MEIVVISREMVKPSCTTPHHLRRSNLSFIDQLVAPVFMPMIFFYSAAAAAAEGPAIVDSRRITNHEKTSSKLKKSLSENLTKFYLLAGRLRQNRFVECNDEGVEYLEAHSKSQISQVVRDSNLGELNKLVPHHGLSHAGNLPLSIQVTFFRCGAVVIGACFNHKLSDASSIFTFVNSWAAAARGDLSNMYSHGFDDLAKLFPPRDVPEITDINNIGIAEEKIVAKRFVFEASALSAVKAKYSTTSVQPTRVEALSAFIWSRFVATTQGPKTHFQVLYPINLRRILNPPLPNSYFGNAVGSAVVSLSCSTDDDDKEVEGYGFVIRTRDAIRRIGGDYIKQFQEGNPQPRYANGSTKGEAVNFSFSSLLRLGVYEADFGWGEPILVTMAQLPRKNKVFFLPTRSGDGVEALVHMEEDDMAKLEADNEFLDFVRPPAAKVCFLSSL